MSLRELTDPSLELVHRVPALPQVDLAHSMQVMRLALALFDDLSEPLALHESGRDLLAVAAYWHDTGQSISEQRHHKHSYAMIMALDMPHWEPHTKQQVACIARYHRKALPNPKHEGFSSLGKTARRQVCELAALLRVADGLDYSHRGLVWMVRSRLDNDVVRLTAYANLEAETEIRRAYQKADLFRKAFGREIEIRREG